MSPSLPVSPSPPEPAATAADGVRVRVPAKINLALKVGAPRADGYHPLATVYHAVSLYDEVRARADEPGRFTVAVTGEGAAAVPVDDRNLAVRAARLLAERHGGDRPRGVALTITKAIPVAGGLAGGSGDGAAALLACAALWDLDLTVAELHPLAAELGSDVPFALVGATAVGSGRGEEVAPALTTGSYHWVLALQADGLSTPAVYARFDELSGPPPGAPVVPEPLMDALRAGDAAALGRAFDNDLQPAALDLRPGLREVLRAGERPGVLGAVVSGSGPTCAFLVADDTVALQLANQLEGSGLCRSARRVTGPVPGARIVG